MDGRIHMQKLSDFLDSIVPHKDWEFLDPVLREITHDFKGDYPEEVRSVHDACVELGFGGNITYGQIGFMQLFYEIDNACTSIVARNSEGVIYHSRNLDYSLHGLQNLTATVAFTRGGKVLFYGSQYIGYLGLLTGSRPGGWSVSVNQRFEARLPEIPVVDALRKGARSIGMFLRDTMTLTNNYHDALDIVNKTYLDDPAYIIMGGLKNNEGAIVTRSRGPVPSCMDCGENPWPLGEDNWYRLETNFDHWLPIQDGRRTAAHKSMNELSPKTVDSKSLYRVLSRPPVLSTDTTYTASMSANLSKHETVVRSHATPSQKQLEHRREKARLLLKALLESYGSPYAKKMSSR